MFCLLCASTGYMKSKEYESAKDCVACIVAIANTAIIIDVIYVISSNGGRGGSANTVAVVYLPWLLAALVATCLVQFYYLRRYRMRQARDILNEIWHDV